MKCNQIAIYIIGLVLILVLVNMVYQNRNIYEPLTQFNRNVMQTRLSTLIDINNPATGQLISDCTNTSNQTNINTTYNSILPAINILTNSNYTMNLSPTVDSCNTQQPILQKMYNNLNSYTNSLTDVYSL